MSDIAGLGHATTHLMDEHFERFLADFSPAIDKRDVPASSIERYRGKLPDQLLTYWQEQGWCGYADGLFWTVDPQEYEPALEAWIGDTSFMEKDAYHLIARSAFGTIYFWGERTGFALKLFAPGAYVLPRNPRAAPLNKQVQTFFGFRDRAENDFSDENGQRLLYPAIQKLGRLQHDEMYGFVPALALGGLATLKNLQTVKAVEHLVLLAQLSELRVMNAPSI